MVDCPRCGAPNREGSRFCSQCGSPLAEVPVAPAAPEPVVPPEEAGLGSIPALSEPGDRFAPQAPEQPSADAAPALSRPSEDGDIRELIRRLRSRAEEAAPEGGEQERLADMPEAPAQTPGKAGVPGEEPAEPSEGIPLPEVVIPTETPESEPAPAVADVPRTRNNGVFSDDLIARLAEESEAAPGGEPPSRFVTEQVVKEAFPGEFDLVETTRDGAQEPPVSVTEPEARAIAVPEPVAPEVAEAAPAAESLPEAEPAEAEPQEADDWLAVPPAAISEDELPELAGVLTGMRGTLPRAIGIDVPPSAQVRATSRPAVAGQDQARLFGEIVTEPLSTAYPPRPLPHATKRAKGAPWLVSLVVAAAVVLPFFVPGLLPRASGAEYPAVDDARNVVEELPEGGTVLIASEVDPGLVGEMEPAVDALVAHLMERKVRFAVVSTLPTGPAVAQQMVESAVVTDTTRVYRYGIEYLNLGYLPGQETGLRRLTEGLGDAVDVDWSGTPLGRFALGQSLKDLGGVDQWPERIRLIVVVAGSEEPLKRWLEQVGARANVPMIAAVSAAIEPSARAYYASGQLRGLIAGRLGAAAYQEGRPEGASAGTGVALEAQTLTQGAVVGLIVLGNLVYWGRRALGVKE